MDNVQKLQFKSLGSQDSVPKPFTGLPFKAVFPDKEAHKPAQTSNAQSENKSTAAQPGFSDKDLLDSRQKGYEEGYAKGYAGAKTDEAETAKKIQLCLEDVTLKLAALSEAIKARNETHTQNMVILALKIARKIAGSALKNDPYIEIENVFLNNINLLFDEPQINISVSPEIVENISARITELAKIEGFKNNIEIIGNPALPTGSCDIKWSGGGIRSNKDEVWKQIEELCESL